MKKIPGFERYSINSEGDVFSFCKSIPMKLKQKTTMFGYKEVVLRKNAKSYYFRVHQLVALTFIPNPNGLPWVNHKNGIKSDNRISNLEWSDPLHNAHHAALNGLYRQGERHQNSVFTNKQAYFIKFIGPKLGFRSCEMMKMFGCSKSAISHIRTGRWWRHLSE